MNRLALFSLLLEVVGGAFTGYQTNNYAIKMLFKKYGPFGGVIVKTREEFIERISALVERDIINARTLENELKRDEFRQIFEEIIDHLLTESIYQNLGESTVNDVPGMEETMENMVDFYQFHSEEFISKSLESLFPNIEVKNLLSDGQIEYLSGQFIDKTLEIFQDSDLLDRFLVQVHQENGDKELTEFIAPSIFKQVADNFEGEMEDFHLELKAGFEDEITEFINLIYQELEIKQVITNLEDHFKEKSLSQFVGQDKRENIANQLLERVVLFLKSGEGKSLIENFLRDILQVLKEIEVPVVNLLGEDLGNNLEAFLADKLPQVIEELLSWIKENSDNIDGLIEEAIQDTLQGEGSGFFNWKAKIKQGLYQMVAEGDFANKFGIVNEIVDFLENKTEIEEVSERITGIIIGFLRENRIGQLIETMEERGVIKVEELAQLIENNLDRFVESMDLSRFDQFFERKLGEILTIDLTEQFEVQIKDALIQQAKDKFLFNTPLTRFVQHEVAKQIIQLGHTSIETLVGLEDLEGGIEPLKDIIEEMLTGKKEMVKEKILGAVNEFIGDKRLSDLLEAEARENISIMVSRMSTNFIKKEMEEIKDKELTDFLDQLNQRENLAGDLTDFILELIDANLHNILEGKIQEAVSGNLSKLPDEDVQQVLENFMGTELKPITRFGAILGTISAILLYFLQSQFGINDLAIRLPVSAAVYGFVGYITNVIALQMIFKPYEEKRFLGLKLPFTPGVVAKEKPRFAEAMAGFVDEELLNKDSVEELFKEKREMMVDNFAQTIAKDEYQMIDDLLKNNQEDITKRLFEQSYQFFEENNQDLTRKLTEELKELKMAPFDFSTVGFNLKRRGKELLGAAGPEVKKSLQEYLESDKKLGQLLGGAKEPLFKKLNHLIEDTIQEFGQQITEERIHQLLSNFSGEFDRIINNSLAELLPLEEQEKLKSLAGGYLIEKLKSEESRDKIFGLVEDKVLNEIHPDKKIGQLFNGILVKGLADNSQMIINSVMGQGINLISNNRDRIKGEIQQAAAEKFGFLYKLAKFIDIDATIGEIVDNLIDDKLPRFLSEREDDLDGILQQFIAWVAESKVGDIGIDLSPEGIRGIIDNLLNNPDFTDKLELLAGNIIDSLALIRIKSLLKIISIESLDDAVGLFDEEITLLIDNLEETLTDNKKVISLEGLKLLTTVSEDLVMKKPVSAFTGDLDQAHISKSIERIIKKISYSPAFNQSLDRYIEDMVNLIKSDKLEDLLDLEQLQQDLNVTVDKLLKSKKAETDLKFQFEEILKIILININQIIRDETKDYTLDTGINSMLDSVEANFLGLVNSIDIAQVTRRQVKAMDAREIEELFDSFAGSYFRKLEVYGFIGAVVGIITESIKLFF